MTTGGSLREPAERALDWLRAQCGGGLEAELYLARGSERSIELREGRLDGVQHSASEGVGLRLVESGRLGFASAGGVSLETVQEVFRRSREQLDYLEPDHARGFPAPAAGEPSESLAASLWDEGLFSEEWNRLIPRLREMEARALAFDRRISRVLRLGYGESRGEILIANTRGVWTAQRGGLASVGLSAIASDGADLQVGSAFQSERQRGVLDFSRVASQSAERSVALLGAVKIPGGRRSVLFDPWAAGEFLDLVAGLLGADQVQRGKSLLAGKRGRKIASELVTFIDDPRRPGGMGSSLYDDEGCPTAAKTMVEGGVLKDYFYDTYTANKEGRSGNASAGRGSYKGLPGPDCSNFHLAPGRLTREAILADTRDGVLVLEVMGMHMADPISGEFSVGVSGIAVEKGRLSCPVKGAMISGNLLDLLSRIDAVADDLTFYGAMGAPTFRIAHMTVA